MKNDLPNDVVEEYRRMLYETFKAFSSFCDANSISFYGAYGTAIGAVRHNGLIPWDDDIDVVMLRSDYNKFLSLKEELKETDYSINDWKTPGYYLPFAKWCNNKTTILPRKTSHFVLGVFIDIFPLDYFTGSKKAILRKSRFRRIPIRFYMLLNTHYKIKSYSRFNLLYCLTRPFVIFKPLLRKYILNQETNNRARKGFLVSPYSEYREKDIYPVHWFNGSISIPFGESIMPVPSHYDEYLTQLYGNYRCLPPEEQRISRHDMYYLNLSKRVSIADIISRSETAKDSGIYLE